MFKRRFSAVLAVLVAISFLQFCFNNMLGSSDLFSGSTLDGQIKAKQESYKSKTIQDAVDLLNKYRRMAGVFAEVSIDATMSELCSYHIEYMITNGVITHYEDPALEGYTPEGHETAKQSLLAKNVVSVYEAIELWFSSLYHRLPLLDPRLEKIGIYFKDQYVCVNVIKGLNLKKTLDHVILFPVNGQVDVPHAFYVFEQPSPVDASVPLPLGYTLTLTAPTNWLDLFEKFSVDIYSKGTKKFLLEGEDYLIKRPNNPNDANSVYQQNTFAIIPLRPLEPNTTYTIHIKNSISIPWEFTSAAN